MKLEYPFYHRPCLEVARELVGKVLVHQTDEGVLRLRITETEAYCGEADTACHVSRGRTKRNEVLYADAGTVYVYLCYGIHSLMNIITGDEGEPQGVLIRACEGFPGPGRLTKRLGITLQNNRSSVCNGGTLWVDDDGVRFEITTAPRVGISYASPVDQARPWRFIAGERMRF